MEKKHRPLKLKGEAPSMAERGYQWHNGPFRDDGQGEGYHLEPGMVINASPDLEHYP